jgi:hypothetical protein
VTAQLDVTEQRRRGMSAHGAPVRNTHKIPLKLGGIVILLRRI